MESSCVMIIPHQPPTTVHLRRRCGEAAISLRQLVRIWELRQLRQRIWDAVTGECEQTLEGHSDAATKEHA